jgi:hypothetical protein
MYRSITTPRLKRVKVITFICLLVALFALSATPKQLRPSATTSLSSPHIK